MDEGTPRLLLEGRPGIGKTIVARRLVALLEGGVPVGGFTTAELRTGGRRQGFVVEAVSGAQEVLAHVDLPGPPRAGRYGVDWQPSSVWRCRRCAYRGRAGRGGRRVGQDGACLRCVL